MPIADRVRNLSASWPGPVLRSRLAKKQFGTMNWWERLTRVSPDWRP